MSDNQRRLLPYEHQLIEALGVSKEDYLSFVAQQHIYNDVKEGTVLDVRNAEGTVALVLAIVGMLAQVASILLMPRPSIPSVSAGPGQVSSREEVFAPRFGFNSVQQLAAYGDPVNLVYTNREVNPQGGVRIAGSLIWSAVQSYGNSQFVQLLFVLGAGGLGAIDLKRSAFGQTALRDLIAQNYWNYFESQYTGALRNASLRPDPYGQVQGADPSAAGEAFSNPYRIRTAPGSALDRVEGFSHAYSPSTANTFGIYGILPIAVQIRTRNEKGDFEIADNRVTSNFRTSSLGFIDIGQEIEIIIEDPEFGDDTLAGKTASNLRSNYINIFDNSGIFKLGSTKFRPIRLEYAGRSLVVKLKAIEGGRGSFIPYAALAQQDLGNYKVGEEADTSLNDLSTRLNAINYQVQSLLNEDNRRVDDDEARSFRGTGRELSPLELADKGNVYRWEAFVSMELLRPGGVAREVLRERLIFIRTLNAQEISVLREYDSLQSEFRRRRDGAFYVKALVRTEEAAYETISPCNIVDFSIKARVFKRVSGRQTVYGSSQRPGYPASDNGLKMRSAMFTVRYKRTTDANYTYFPGIFVVRRSADIDNYVFLRFHAPNGEQAHWQFKFEPVFDPPAEFAKNPTLVSPNGSRLFHYLENFGSPIFNAPFEHVGSSSQSIASFPPLNDNPVGMDEWGLFTVSSDEQLQFSFDNGPEMAIAAVSEQIVTPFSGFPTLYKNLALFGLNMYSGRNVQDLRSFSVFADKGRHTRALRTEGVVNGLPWGHPDFEYLTNGNEVFANTAPDIFIDTVLDVDDGIGAYADLDGTNLEQLARSKKFCLRNKLFMDGIIAEPSSWREFWSRIAGFSLLELGRQGGQDVLVPAVPYDRQTGEISRNVSISALFNAGNILEDSYKEEFIDYGDSTQDVILTMIYRTTDADAAFSRNATVEVKFADIIENNALRETIDMSAFVTRKEQAIAVGKLLCNIRRFSRRAIEFKTFPVDGPVFPGAYIYMELAQNQWQNIYSGSIEENDFLNTPLTTSIPNGDYSMLLYRPTGTTTFPADSVNINNFVRVRVRNGRGYRLEGGNEYPLLGGRGYLFVLGTSMANKRVFRVTEVLMDEEGETTIRAVEHGTDANGLSLISRGIANIEPGLFMIDSELEQ
jgi:hypothetical protein